LQFFDDYAQEFVLDDHIGTYDKKIQVAKKLLIIW